jgi:Ni,Fe-hydrogenase III component G
LNIYDSLKTALKVLVEMRRRLGEDAKMSFNMTKVKIYIPGVTRERARELVLQHIEQDPSLESLPDVVEVTTDDQKLRHCPHPAEHERKREGRKVRNFSLQKEKSEKLLSSLRVRQDEDNGEVAHSEQF